MKADAELNKAPSYPPSELPSSPARFVLSAHRCQQEPGTGLDKAQLAIMRSLISFVS
ncbi:hypothetical protein SynPROSU1_00177 [Synechococcus sp. PROS-U-1]|nr:hypothetical protein SynPROSU1_00177 [Synechococcus sp. PROS-U-1]